MTEFDKFVTVRGHKRGGSTALVRAALARGHDDPTLELSPCVTPVPRKVRGATRSRLKTRTRVRARRRCADREEVAHRPCSRVRARAGLAVVASFAKSLPARDE